MISQMKGPFQKYSIGLMRLRVIRILIIVHLFYLGIKTILKKKEKFHLKRERNMRNRIDFSSLKEVPKQEIISKNCLLC